MKKIISAILIIILVLLLLGSASFLVYRTEKFSKFNTFINSVLIFLGKEESIKIVDITEDFSVIKDASGNSLSFGNKKIVLAKTEKNDFSKFVNSVPSSRLPNAISAEFSEDGYSLTIKKEGITVNVFTNEYPIVRQLYCFSDGILLFDFSGNVLFLDVLPNDIVSRSVFVEKTGTIIAPRQIDLVDSFIKVLGRNGETVIYEITEENSVDSDLKSITDENDVLFNDLFPTEKAWHDICFFCSNYFDTSNLENIRNADEVGTYPFLSNTFPVSDTSVCTLGKFCVPENGTYSFNLYNNQNFKLKCWAFVAVFQADGVLLDCNVQYSADNPTVSMPLQKDEEVYMVVSFMGEDPGLPVFAGCELE